MLINLLAGIGSIGIVKKIFQGALAVTTERLMQADRMPRYDAQRLGLFGRDADDGGDLFHGRFAALLDRQFAADTLYRCQGADLMARHTDGARMIGQGTGDALANPPSRIGAELVTQAMLVLIYCPHQAAIAFLNQIGERQAAAAIALGNRDDQTQIALSQF